MILSLIPGCLTPEQAVAEVDREAYGIVGEKQVIVRGGKFTFRVEVPKGRLVDELLDPKTQLARSETPVVVNLADVLQLSAQNSRRFQDEKELLYRAALDLMRQREDFRNTPFGLFAGSITDSNDVQTVTNDSEVGVTRMLQQGGNVALSVGLNFLRVISSPTSESLNTFLNLAVSLPILRNAGVEIATENLIQSDRDALYAMRDFERFKQTFSVQVISQYLRLLVQMQRIKNEEANVKSLEFARKRNEQLAKEGRLPKIEVDQALQSELQGRDRLVTTKQTFEQRLDGLKSLMSIPLDAPITVRIEDLEQVQKTLTSDLEVDETRMTRLGLHARLDLRNVVAGVADSGRRLVVARDQLKPDLTLNLSARATSQNMKPLKYNFNEAVYSASVNFDPGLDRDVESIAYRRAMLDVQRALRTQMDFIDQVKSEVRSAVRILQQQRETYLISKRSVELAQQRVVSSREFLELGRASTRDFLESQAALIQNQNQLVNNLVEYRIAYLELLRDTGVLVVSPEGLDHDTSVELLTQN